MSILDNDTIAKLRAMKNKMLGLDEDAIETEIKQPRRGKPLVKTTRTVKVEKVINGKRCIEEQTVEKIESVERHERSIERDKIRNIRKTQKIRDIFLSDNKAKQNNQVFTEDIDLCIGLDVGTSTTKAVIKEVYTDDDSFYIVDFADYGIKEQEYLIPTYLCEKDGVFTLPKYNQAFTHTNLKLNFIESQKNADLYFRAYIALVIKYIKKWFEREHGNDDIIKNKNIIWQVNLGIPSAQFNNDGDNAKFLKVLKEAYYLSNQSEISIKDSVIEENKVDLNIVPEIIASIQSYIKRNDISHEGLYCVSDVGAGTLDLCTFRVKEDDMGNVVYSFFKSKVERLGTKEYQATLTKYKQFLADMVLNKEKEIQKRSIGYTITDPDEYLIDNEIRKQQLIDIDAYRNEVMKCYCNVLFRTYKDRDPNAKEWVETLPIAISGGGISIPFYQTLIKNDLTQWLTKHCGDQVGNDRCKGFRSIDIKNNRNNFVTKCKNIDCTRIAVALGLSYSINNFDDIKKYYKEWEIENIQALSKVSTESNYISKDQV